MAMRGPDAEPRESIDDVAHDGSVRKTEFVLLADGHMRRGINRNGYIIEKGEVISVARAHIVAARGGTDSSQSAFARLLEDSVPTLQDWESGRRLPSGAAGTLLRIAPANRARGSGRITESTASS